MYIHNTIVTEAIADIEWLAHYHLFKKANVEIGDWISVSSLNDSFGVGDGALFWLE